MNNLEVKKLIWFLMDNIRGNVYTQSPAFSAIRLLFLKYVVDNNIGVSSIDDMQQCARAQKMFAMRDVETGVDTTLSVLKYIDRAFNLDNVLSDCIHDYARELFGIEPSALKKNIPSDRFKNLLDMLGSNDFEEKRNDHTIGRMLVDEFIEVFYQSSNRKSFTGMFTSKRSLNSLVRDLLCVTETDVFCDFASGTGLSTLVITKDVDPCIVNVEINPSIAALSAMLYILYGYSHIHVICADSLLSVIPGIHGDKIFVDGPIAVKLEDTGTNKYRDSSLAILDKTIHQYLNNNGTAILTMPGATLFNLSKPALSLRKELLQLGMIDSVIALPPLWNGTSIGTNLLILHKGLLQKNILFINALDIIKADSKNNAKSSGELSKEAIVKIVRTVMQRETIDGFSVIVDQSSIQKNQYNLTPANYVTAKIEEDTSTLESIDEALRALYESLQE